MLKKSLLVSAIALGLSSVALANGSMAPVATATATAAAPVSPDYVPGIYVGLQGGMVDSGYEAWKNVVGVKNYNGVGGRVLVGYDFHKNFAVELGYMFDFTKTKLSVLGTDFADVRTQAIDLVGKIKAPIMDNFGLYAKLGPGFLMEHGSGVNGVTGTANTNKFDVVYGAGAYYTFATNWAVDLSWTRYNSGKTKMFDTKWQPNVDFYALGVSYKFELPA